MNSDNVSGVLNRLYVIHNRSLPIYLGYAKPYALRGDEQAKETLEHIVVDQQKMVERLGAMLLDGDGDITPGEFPMAFTGYHDLSYAFLIQRMIDHQRRDITAIQQCVTELNSASMAKSLAEECLGAAKAHLDSLVDLTQQTTGT